MSKKDSRFNVSLFPVDGIHHFMDPLCKRLSDLGITAVIAPERKNDFLNIDFRDLIGRNPVFLSDLVEYVIQRLPFEFEDLTTLIEGESKIIKLLNSKMVVEKFKPTVYSFTHNRYGEVEGTAELRVLFTAELFRRMNRYNVEQGKHLRNAFLAVVNTSDGPLLVQEKVESCNLEVRVKRYHIGSPVHRYKYTERYNTVQLNEMPLTKWTRFDVPLVCFDWRLPLTDEEGNRLADEPISDDYAGVWMSDIAEAKYLARETFSWMESIFRDAGLLLIDICFFIDKSGHMLYGEISPDCMRVREGLGDPHQSESFDKDLWRQGEKEKLIAKRYHKLFHILFSQTEKFNDHGKSDNQKQAHENVSGWSDHIDSSSAQGSGYESKRTGTSIGECF
ncbi:MAG TPA: phosphoribosylaminoimidazolesuccinocarboxamide synthase [Bacteroidia bacterium]|nr:phosphoribosylaminoimidazolesuccinocarboxamide synthase [Bacteroidia bacterium]